MRRKTRRLIFAVAAIILVICVLIGRTLHTQKLERDRQEAVAAAVKAALPPLKAADPAIEAIEVEKPLVTVRANVKAAPDLAGNIDIVARTTAAVGAALKRGVSDDLSQAPEVRMDFRAEAIDRFGHDVMAPLVTMDFDAAALAKADLSDNALLLGLAQTVSLGAPGAYDAVDAWCRDAPADRLTFCAKAKENRRPLAY